MRLCARSGACASCWGDVMGMFSFLSDLTGKKDDTAKENAVAVAAAESEGMVDTPTPSPTPSPATHPPVLTDTPFTAPEAWKAEPMAQTPPVAAPATSQDGLQVGPLDAEQTAALQGKIVEAIKTVFDPEIPVDIYELGLIYDIIVDAQKNVLVNMTLTSPACPSAQQLPVEVRHKVRSIPEVTDARVEIVWEPAWTKERMSEAAKLTLGFF
jgi:FeS assembly SUF system protein